MKTKRKFYTLLIFFLTLSVVKAQDKVFMPFFEVLNMHYEYQYSSSKLFKSYVDQDNKYDIILPIKPDSIFPTESFEQTHRKAKALNTKYFLIGTMNRIGEVVIVSLIMYKTEDGSKFWSDMLKAQNPDDLDHILTKLARNMGTEKKATDDGDIYAVTDYESKELSKINANYNFGLSIGGAVPFMANPPIAAGFGVMGSYDSRKIILELRAEGYFHKTVKVYGLGLAALYPFKSESNTPYLGAGLGLANFSINKEEKGSNPNNNYYDNPTKSGGGLMVLAGGGYIINRHSNVMLRLSAKAFLSLFKVESSVPAGIMFDITILFPR